MTLVRQWMFGDPGRFPGKVRVLQNSRIRLSIITGLGGSSIKVQTNSK